MPTSSWACHPFVDQRLKLDELDRETKVLGRRLGRSRYEDSPSSSRSRRSTRDFATRTAPGSSPARARPPGVSRPSTAVSQNACQVRSSNSPRIRSRPRPTTPRSAVSSLESSSSDGPAAGSAREPDLGVRPAAPSGSRPSFRKWSWTLFRVIVRSQPRNVSPALSLRKRRDVGGHRLENVLEDVGDLLLAAGPSGGTIGRPAARTGRPAGPRPPRHPP